MPLVVDPVMVAKGGQALLAPDAVGTLKRRLLPLATLLTPNLPEAEALTGLPIRDTGAMRARRGGDADARRAGGAAEGRALTGDTVVDLLATEAGIEEFSSPRIATRHTHGTGCTLASAIAAGLAQGMALRDAVTRARALCARGDRHGAGLRSRARADQPRGHGRSDSPPRDKSRTPPLTTYLRVFGLPFPA